MERVNSEVSKSQLSLLIASGWEKELQKKVVYLGAIRVDGAINNHLLLQLGSRVELISQSIWMQKKDLCVDQPNLG